MHFFSAHYLSPVPNDEKQGQKKREVSVIKVVAGSGIRGGVKEKASPLSLHLIGLFVSPFTFVRGWGLYRPRLLMLPIVIMLVMVVVDEDDNDIDISNDNNVLEITLFIKQV